MSDAYRWLLFYETFLEICYVLIILFLKDINLYKADNMKENVDKDKNMSFEIIKISYLYEAFRSQPN